MPGIWRIKVIFFAFKRHIRHAGITQLSPITQNCLWKPLFLVMFLYKIGMQTPSYDLQGN